MFRASRKEERCIIVDIRTRIHIHTRAYTRKEKIFICAVKMIYVYIGDSRIYDARVENADNPLNRWNHPKFSHAWWAEINWKFHFLTVKRRRSVCRVAITRCKILGDLSPRRIDLYRKIARYNTELNEPRKKNKNKKNTILREI